MLCYTYGIKCTATATWSTADELGIGHDDA